MSNHKETKEDKTTKYDKINNNKGMIGIRRKFNDELHDKYDVPARQAIKDALGDFVIDHPDEYAQDLIINSPTCSYKYLEVQVCTTWLDKYPYDTVHIYARKARYDDDTLFITLNRAMTKGYIFSVGDMKLVPRRLKKYSREFVYDIPWGRCMLVYLNSIDRETIELY
jgi:hypothetical protein